MNRHGLAGLTGKMSGTGRLKNDNKLTVPYVLDFSSIANGSLPSRFTGSTWTVTGGLAKNTPGTTEKLVNGGFEAAPDFTGWIQLAGDGSISIETTLVHGGSKAAKLVTGPSFNTNLIQAIAVIPAGSKCLYSVWTRGDGTHWTSFSFVDTTNWVSIWVANGTLGTSYVNTKNLCHVPWNCTSVNVYGSSSSANGANSYFDDFSLLLFTQADLFALSEFHKNLVMVKARWSIATYDEGGVVACADSLTNPQNYVVAYHDGTKAYMAKVVGGVPSADLISTAVTYVDKADLEIRHTAINTFQLWYNNVQIGTDQTINDAGIVNNTIHGLYGVGISGNSHCHLFTVAPVAARSIVFVGGSITAGASATDADHRYVNLVMEYLETYTAQYGYSWVNSGVGGTGSWYGLTRLTSDVLNYNPDMVCIDFSVNDMDWPLGKSGAEAFIRRIRTAFPNVRLCVVHFLLVAGSPGTDPTNLAEAIKQNWITLCNHYGIPWADFALDVQTKVGSGSIALTDVLADQVHPNNGGHALAASLYEGLVASQLNASGGILPARIFDNGDFENAPIIRNGVDNDGETGTGWSTVGTARQSSTAGDTIKWTGTCQSFGLDYGTPAGVIQWQAGVGQPWYTRDLSLYGTDSPIWDGSTFRASRTITIKVVSGTIKINRFLAI